MKTVLRAVRTGVKAANGFLASQHFSRGSPWPRLPCTWLPCKLGFMTPWGKAALGVPEACAASHHNALAGCQPVCPHSVKIPECLIVRSELKFREPGSSLPVASSVSAGLTPGVASPRPICHQFCSASLLLSFFIPSHPDSSPGILVLGLIA